MKKSLLTQSRKTRHRRIRAKVRGTKERPRLCVFRSNQHLYAQLVDDVTGKILAAVSDIKTKTKEKASKGENAKAMGKTIAKKATEQGVLEVVFDRGGYKYHGSVQALAQGAREGGLKF